MSWGSRPYLPSCCSRCEFETRTRVFFSKKKIKLVAIARIINVTRRVVTYLLFKSGSRAVGEESRFAATTRPHTSRWPNHDVGIVDQDALRLITYHRLDSARMQFYMGVTQSTSPSVSASPRHVVQLRRISPRSHKGLRNAPTIGLHVHVSFP